MFKKIEVPKVEKPSELKKEAPKTMVELLKEKNFTVDTVIQELKQNGLTDRESSAFVDIFVNNVHYSRVAEKYSIQFTEVLTLHNKFSILARKYGFDPNLIIKLLK